MQKMCKDCLHFDHCVNIPNYPVTENTIGCDDWESKDKYVPVVRCKDCKYWESGKNYEPYCNHWASMMHETVADDYCSYGERRGE